MPAVPMNLRDQAYQRFTRGLLAREIHAGQFVTQRQLTAITGMPLGAIRELIPRLEADGLIRTVPQRGMQVAHVDVDLIRNAFEFRTIIEREAAARFAVSAPDAELDEIEEAHRAVLAAAAKGMTPALVARAQRVDDGLHERMVDALGNAIVANAFRVNFIKIRLIRQSQTTLDAPLVEPVMHARSRGGGAGDRDAPGRGARPRAGHRARAHGRRRRGSPGGARHGFNHRGVTPTTKGVPMRKTLIALALAAVAAPALSQQVTIRWGDVVPATHPSVQMIERVAADVKAKSNGRIAIQAFPAGQLGGSRDMIDAVANGAQQIVTEGAANFGAWVPSISVVEAPYVWRDAAHLQKAMSGPVGQKFNETLVKARGMRILGTTYYGTRHITTTSKEVKTPADLAGFKLRVPENDVFKAMAEAWGAKPTPMNFGELYLALKQNVVDGQENPLPTIKSGKFDEVQKYLVLSGHIITPRLVVVNEAFWQGLSAADRKLVEDAIRAGIAWQDEELARQEKSLVDTFRAAGMTVITPDANAFRAPVLAKVPKMFESKWGAGTFEAIQAIK
jgi:tripartite ATP-independent transporter DctP family solute receptor